MPLMQNTKHYAMTTSHKRGLKEWLCGFEYWWDGSRISYLTIKCGELVYMLSKHITNLTSNLVRPLTELQGHGKPGSHTPRDGTPFPASIPVSSTPPESAQPLLRSLHNRHAVQICFDILEQHACHICLKSTRFWLAVDGDTADSGVLFYQIF